MAGVAIPGRAAAGEITRTPRAWLFGPWLDALLIANLGWPLLLLAQWGEGFSGRDGVQFWQLYYITTPHRWITLVLVFLDRERFRERRLAFLGIAAAIVAVCLSVRLATGALTCLLAIDYVWNAWHFAAQHHGIYRIYGRLASQRGRESFAVQTYPHRQARPQSTPDPLPVAQPRGHQLWRSSPFTGLTIDKWLMRLFLLYVILRVATATWSDPAWERGLATTDWLFPAIPLWLIAKDLARARSGSLGGTTYLLSVSALYLSLLAAVHWHRPALILSLATASALFHAIEYLSLVTWSVQRRHAASLDRAGMLAYLLPRWALALGMFILILGISGWLLDQHLLKTWLLINVIVAFLHYAYDGMIWRTRYPATVPFPSGRG